MYQNKIMNLSDFLEQNISPLILGAFYSHYVFTKDQKYIVTYTSYNFSKKIQNEINYDKKYLNEYLNILNEESQPYTNWIMASNIDKNEVKIPRGQIFFILKNDLNLNSNSFFNKLYAKIMSDCDWIYDTELTESKKQFIRGFMEMRGSIDPKRNFITQDYRYNSIFEIKKARLLIDYLAVPHYLFNYNFRDLQEEFYTKTTLRETQLRINLKWYMTNIGLINLYKAKRFAVATENKCQKIGNIYYSNCYEETEGKSNIFDNRLNFYVENIMGKKITSENIKEMREKLGFDAETKGIRSSSLKELVRLLNPDECLGCKNHYKIEDRTYINKTTGRPHFDVHHMISLGKNKELDVENNLVKLCPACHDTLKRGAADKAIQTKLIREIYNNAPNVLEFAEHFFDTTYFDEIIELTFNRLK